MANVLPQSEKKKIYREYMLRLAVLVLVFLAVFFVISSIFLLPTYVLSLAEREATKERVATLDLSLEQQDEQVLETFDTIKQKAAFLLSHYKRSELLPMVTAAIEEKGAGISLTSLFYSNKGADAGQLVLRGIAQNRESLTRFARRLENEALFGEVTLPVSNLAQDRNIDFSLTIDVIRTP